MCRQLGNWARARRQGKVTGSSGGYILPNGANRAADATRSEVTLSRTHRGAADAPVRYQIAIVPPR